MPLSEHEQRLLDQMERALYEEDPGFATQMKSSRASASRGRIVAGVLIALAGLAVVIAGVNAASIPLGVIGFAVLVGGIVWAVTPAHGRKPGAAGARPGAAPTTRRGSAGPRAGSSGSFMERLDERWEKRRREGDM